MSDKHYDTYVSGVKILKFKAVHVAKLIEVLISTWTDIYSLYNLFS